MAHPAELLVLGKITFYLIITLLSLSWTTVVLRMWVRIGITKSLGWDDAAMVFSLCLFTCYCAFILVITVGSTAHQRISTTQLLQSLVYIQLSEVFYILTTTFMKISLGLFFLRLLTKRWQLNLFYSILAISGVFGLVYFFVTIFQCGNPTKLADRLLGAQNCAPTGFLLASGYLYGIINVLADWTFTLVPVFILLDSDMDRRSKISVSIVMGFAAIGSISSILRMVYLKGLFVHSGNFTANSIKATIWATAEPGTGIIAASAAILRPLFRKLASDVRGKITEYGTTKGFGSDRSTRNGKKFSSDTESTISLTPMDPVHSASSKTEKRMSIHSLGAEDPWDERTSMERVRVVSGKIVNIKMVADNGVRPIISK